MVRSAARKARDRAAREAKFRENQKDSLKEGEMHPTEQEQIKSEEKEEKQKQKQESDPSSPQEEKRHKKPKTKKKKKRKQEKALEQGSLVDEDKGKRARTTETEEKASDAIEAAEEVDAMLRSLRTGKGTLSDRLNPSHPDFDKDLKARWKELPKKVRAAVVQADQQGLEERRREGEQAAQAHPFPSEPTDHCESPPEAYADVATLLDMVAKKLGKTRKTLAIYDPFYCAGATVKHLAALGFTSVRNECVDFYDVLERGELPAHDVVVTNPPYSGNHVERLLRFVGLHDKPYLLLMPNHVCLKPFFFPSLCPNGGCVMPSGKWCPYQPSQRQEQQEEAAGLFRRPMYSSSTKTSGNRSGEGPIFVCPRKRYYYWTPKAMRPPDKHGHCNTTLGQRTSPFISFWYVDLEPTVARAELLKFGDRQTKAALEQSGSMVKDWRSGGSGRESADNAARNRPPPFYCSEMSHLPKSVRPSSVQP